MSEVRVVFFASLREAVGTGELQCNVQSVDELLAHLRSTLAAQALTALGAENVRMAINQQLVDGGDWARVLTDGDEVAFLPPVTGG